MKPGPTVKITAECNGCSHLISEKYVCQSDWGFDYYCGLVGRKDIGDSGRTPAWCPLLKETRDRVLHAALGEASP